MTLNPNKAEEPARWWSTRQASVNGVFKGGGAKGLLYAARSAP